MQIKILVPVLILVVDLLLCNLILISSVLIILHPFIIHHILSSYSVILTESLDRHRSIIDCGWMGSGSWSPTKVPISGTLCRRCQIATFVYNELYISLFIMFYVLVG